MVSHSLLPTTLASRPDVGVKRSADPLRDSTLPSHGIVPQNPRVDNPQNIPDVGLNGRLHRLAMTHGISFETAAVQMLLKHSVQSDTYVTGRLTPRDLFDGLRFIQKHPGGELAIAREARGELIREVQQRLSKLGHFDGTPTATFASKTERAVAAFQAGIPVLASQPRGVVTIDTLTHLLQETGWQANTLSAKEIPQGGGQVPAAGGMSRGFDHEDLARMEGHFRTKGYTLPSKQYPSAGVTISNGVDLGQWSRKELLSIGVSPAVVEKLAPYTKESGLRGAAAEKYLKAHPIEISPAESKHLYEKVFGEILHCFAQHYEKSRGPNAPHFAELPDKLKTVFGSMAFNIGPNFSEVSGNDAYSKWRRTIGDQIFAGNYEKVFQMLVANPHSQDGLCNRRCKEAAIVLEYLAAKDPHAAGRLLASTEAACAKAGRRKTFEAFKSVAAEFKPGLCAGIPVPEGRDQQVVDTEDAKRGTNRDEEPQREKARVHIVRKGDTLSALARRYHCSVDELKEINRLKGDGIVIGQKIRIPGLHVAENERARPSVTAHELAQMSSYDPEPPRMRAR